MTFQIGDRVRVTSHRWSSLFPGVYEVTNPSPRSAPGFVYVSNEVNNSDGVIKDYYQFEPKYLELARPLEHAPEED